MHNNNSLTRKNNSHSQLYLILGITLIAIIIVFIWRPLDGVDQSTLFVGGSNSKIVASDDFSDDELTSDEIYDKNELSTTEDDENEKEQEEDEVEKEHTIVDGDTLLGVLVDAGVDKSDVYLLSRQNKSLAKLRIGQTLAWDIGENDKLNLLTWTVSRREIRTYQRQGNKFVEKTTIREGTWENVVLSGTIKSSFVTSAKNAGLTAKEINEVTKALQWQFNLRKIQKGDKFVVVISREMLNGRHENSRVQAVRLRNGKTDYYSIAFTNGRYYNKDGKGLERGFARYPLTKSAPISSHFNPSRRHPILGRIMPHNGVDFAVKIGTPVIATGDGEVVNAKYSASAGNYIVLQHGKLYQTRFMHLSRIAVTVGKKVKRGDIIGYSGNTGRSTGPHLHFELLVSGKPVNAITANLPRSEGLTGKARTLFMEKAKSLLPLLKIK